VRNESAFVRKSGLTKDAVLKNFTRIQGGFRVKS